MPAQIFVQCCPRWEECLVRETFVNHLLCWEFGCSAFALGTRTSFLLLIRHDHYDYRTRTSSLIPMVVIVSILFNTNTNSCPSHSSCITSEGGILFSVCVKMNFVKAICVPFTATPFLTRGLIYSE